MKRMLILLSALTITQAASAAVLTCYPSNPKKTYTILTAKIVSDSELNDVRFAKFMKSEEKGLSDLASIEGEMTTSNHSPYKGDMKYSLHNGDILYLPADLSASALENAIATGIGYGKGENAVIIGNAKNWNDGAGNHYRIAMRCYSSAQ